MIAALTRQLPDPNDDKEPVHARHPHAEPVATTVPPPRHQMPHRALASRPGALELADPMGMQPAHEDAQRDHGDEQQ
jgi:hypothetical protein